MIAYVFFKASKIINNKINNVTIISNGEIHGDNIARFGDGSDYIILDSDTINLNIGDNIDITGLEDCRNYFLKSKEEWLIEQLNKANQKNNTLKETVNVQENIVNSLVDTILEISMNITI